MTFPMINNRRLRPAHPVCTRQKVRLAVIWGAPEHQVPNPHEVAHPLHPVRPHTITIYRFSLFALRFLNVVAHYMVVIANVYLMLSYSFWIYFVSIYYKLPKQIGLLLSSCLCFPFNLSLMFMFSPIWISKLCYFRFCRSTYVRNALWYWVSANYLKKLTENTNF